MEDISQEDDQEIRYVNDNIELCDIGIALIHLILLRKVRDDRREAFDPGRTWGHSLYSPSNKRGEERSNDQTQEDGDDVSDDGDKRRKRDIEEDDEGGSRNKRYPHILFIIPIFSI